MPKAWTITICLVLDGHFKFPTQNIFLSIITLFATIISVNSVRIKINEFRSLPKLHGFLFNVAIFRQPLHLKSFRTSHFSAESMKEFLSSLPQVLDICFFQQVFVAKIKSVYHVQHTFLTAGK